MDFSMRSIDLTRELALADSVISSKPTVAVLSNVLVEAADGAVTLSATDLELAVRSRCDAPVAASGTRAVPAKKLLELARTLPDADVRLASDGNSVGFTAAGFRARLQSHPTDDFPRLAKAGAASVGLPAAPLRALIERVRFACSEDDKRYFLAGALLEVHERKVRLVATDAHRLAVAEAALPVPRETLPPMILPRKTLDALHKVLDGVEGDVAFSLDEAHLFFAAGARLLISRTIDGQFPSYERILPKSFSTRVEIPRAPFAEALRRATMVADAKSRKVTLALSADGLTVAAASADVGDADERVALAYDGPEMTVACNVGYVADFLGAVGTERVLMQLNAPNQAIGFRAVGGDVDYDYLVMPVIL